MKIIPLTKGRFAIVDDQDYEWLSKMKWRATRTTPTGIERWYAIHTMRKRKTVYMHREIMLRIGISPNQLVDHRDGNGLNNQRSNLRQCTASQNVQNRRKAPGLSSRFKGVYWHRRDQRWIARLVQNRKSIFLGRFLKEEDAAKAYDLCARRLFGDFALLNLPTAIDALPHP